MQLFSNYIFKISLILILVVCSKLYSQDVYTFQSAPSFHHGFTLKIDIDNDKVYFQTNNNFYFLEKLEKKSNEYPNYKNKIEELHPEVLSNSIFEKSITKNEVDIYLKNINQLMNSCEKNRDSIRVGHDGITFVLSKKLDSCEFWSPRKTTGKGLLINNILEQIKQSFKPNTIIDRYIFNSKIYLEDDDKSFELLSNKPLYLKFYEFPFRGCENFEAQINTLPNENEVFIDVTDIGKPYEKECFIEILNKKFKKITVVQNGEYGYFNE